MDAPTDRPAEPPAPGSQLDLEGTDATPDQAAQAAAAPRRRLKLIVTLESDTAAGRAVLGLIAEDCDPELRVVQAAGLVEALAEVPALLAAADARWREHPRYPAASAPPRRPGPPGAVRRPAGVAEPPPAPAAPADTTPEPAPTGTANQLPLFG